MSVLGIIFSYSERENLRELTQKRTLSALPIAGKYRIIDFAISNYVNNGIYDISVITRDNYHSLMDHLGQGKEWDLVRKRGGLRVLTPYARSEGAGGGIYKGTVDALASHLSSIRRSMADLVILTDASVLYSMDYQKLIERHLETGADITAVYSRQLNGYHTVPAGLPVFKMDENERIFDLTVNTDDTIEQDVPWGLGCYVIQKTLLETVIADSVAAKRYDFKKDILKRLAPRLKIMGCEHRNLLLEISSVSGYMKANMNFLKPEFRMEFFKTPVYTKIKDSVPTQYGQNCKVINSIISDECRIEGTVENSVISRGVRIGKNTVVKDCIIMQHTEIHDNCMLHNVIIDKDVIIRDHQQLSGHAAYPIIIEKASII